MIRSWCCPVTTWIGKRRIKISFLPRPSEKSKEINASIYGITDESTFFDFIQSNMRPQPEEYAKIREINAGLVHVDAEEADNMDLGKNECAASMHA